jgi:hypothetical protein
MACAREMPAATGRTMKDGKYKREEERKFRRIFIRFGLQEPEFRAMAIQISTRGLFISTNNPIFVKGSRLKIEIQAPDGPLQTEAVVRHSKKVLPRMVQLDRPGMGVEFIDPPPELRDLLASL